MATNDTYHLSKCGDGLVREFWTESHDQAENTLSITDQADSVTIEIQGSTTGLNSLMLSADLSVRMSYADLAKLVATAQTILRARTT